MKLDNKLIEAAQATYLWLYDWTGITVGALGFGIIAFSAAWDRVMVERSITNSVIIVLVGALWGVWTQHLQRNQKLYNARAMEWRGSSIRRLMFCFAIGFMVSALYNWNVREALGELPFLVWQYLACAMVRDREPPTWGKLAMERHR